METSESVVKDNIPNETQKCNIQKLENFISFTESFNGTEWWPKAKAAADKIGGRLSMLGDKYKLRGERLAGCGQRIQTLSCPDGHTHRVQRATLCRDRACPICGKLRARRLAAKTAAAMNKSGGRFLLLTLTVPNAEDGNLRQTIRQMTKAFGVMMKTDRLRGVVGGYVRTLEVTRNAKTLTWHPHIHALLRVDNGYFDRDNGLYVHQSEWLALWQDAMSSTEIEVVDIRPADVRGVYEVSKYITKSADLMDYTLPALQEWLEALHGVRLWASGGCMKITEKDMQTIEDNLLHDEDAEKVVICPVCGQRLQKVDWQYSYGHNHYVPLTAAYHWPESEKQRRRRRKSIKDTTVDTTVVHC